MGTTSYTDDDNGNLVEGVPSGATGSNPVDALRYGYNQRNLLIMHTTYVSGTGWVLQAEYKYDGNDDRLQQADYTSGTAMTTTYTNDIFGLTQVLVADDGTNQVTNLYGLDLISQDSGSEVRTLLADGVASLTGSVRTDLPAPARVRLNPRWDVAVRNLAGAGAWAGPRGVVGGDVTYGWIEWVQPRIFSVAPFLQPDPRHLLRLD